MRLATTLALLASLAGCAEETPEPGPSSSAATRHGEPTRATVQRVVDGDTLRVRTSAGRSERVRLLGIDAPELSPTRTGSAQCGGAEAFADLASRLRRGAAVELTTDPTQDRRDRFGRLLAYVAIPGQATTLQEQLLQDGWARVYVYERERPFSRVRAFRRAAEGARQAGVGVWDECGGDFRRQLG